MDNKRRKFLKMAGLSALAGIGAPAIVKLTSDKAVAAAILAFSDIPSQAQPLRKPCLLQNCNNFAADNKYHETPRLAI